MKTLIISLAFALCGFFAYSSPETTKSDNDAFTSDTFFNCAITVHTSCGVDGMIIVQ